MSSDTQVKVKAFVPRWLRQRLRSGWGEPEPRIQSMRAAVLFADIVGFSALTREFSSRGEIGLEQLAVAVSDYFGQLIDSVTAAGGDIENTYGDGFLAFWAEEENGISVAARNAWLCASELTTKFHRFRTAYGSEFQLRAAVLVGDVFAVKAGGTGEQWLFFLAGDCLSEVSDLLRMASPGGIATSSAIREALGDAPTFIPARNAEYRGNETGRAAPLMPLSNSQMLPFLPRALRCVEGQLTEGWLAEFRLVSILFVRFPRLHCQGIGDLPSIQAIVAKVQQIVDRYDGATLRASMNDKGPFILCAFGLPQNTHEDDPQRAQAAARELDAEFRTKGIAARCSVAEGVTYCGMVGGGAHQSYTAMGEAVNRAAKLVAASDEPEIIIDTPRAPVRRDIISHLRAASVSILPDPTQPIGRQIELDWLAQRIELLADGGTNRAVLITGEAGIGKTTLLREMMQRTTGVTVLSSVADPLVGSTTPYAAWRRIFDTLFAEDGTPGSPGLTEGLRRRLARQGEDITLVDLAASVLHLAPSGTEPSRLSPADRARLTRTVLVALLRDQLSAKRAVLLLDDAHWMDAASLSLAAELVRLVPQALLILAARPSDEFEQQLTGVAYDRLSLRPLTEDETRSLLAEALDCREITAEVVSLVQGKAAGNPLFTTQLGLALLEERVLAIDNGRLRFGTQSHSADFSDLSDTVQRVIVSRVDRLTSPLRQTLKAASVVGESFDANLVHALVPGVDVVVHLDRLTSLGLVRRLPNEASSYQFNHGVTREVMYRQMAFTQRRHLHQLAASTLELMETAPADAVLGYHWLNAGMVDRSLPYWERAGYTAFAAGAFAEAAASFDQALACLVNEANMRGQAARIARLYRHAGDAHLQIGNIRISRQHLVHALAALGRKWPVGALATTFALSKEAARQIALEAVPRRSTQTLALRESEREAAQVYETLGQVLGHTSEVNLMCLATVAAVNTSQSSGNEHIYSRACGLLALALLLMRLPAAARRYFRHSIDMRPAQSEPHDWLMTTEYLALYHMSVAEFEAAESALVEMLDVSRSANNRRRWLDAMSLLSITLMCKGELGRCTQTLTDFEREVFNERDPQVLSWVHLEKAELALMRGDAESALRQIDGCKDLIPTLGRNERLWGEGLRALALWRLLRFDDALAAASATSGYLRNPNEIAFYAQGGVFAAAEVYIHALQMGGMDVGATATDARRMMKFLKKFGVRLPICWPRTLMLLGCYHLALGRRRQGMSFLHRARDEAVRQKRPYEEAVAIIVSEASGSVTTKVESAVQSLREMEAEALLGYLPVARSTA